ncbi:MAG: ABC transporter, ATP-binding protein [Mycoplasmataceae bacterium CE_OT135]|nr:MAG: ABC transporter, ATP-binding protein [Mycoplasmataceae bacterium CE_OT135]
MIIRNKMPPPKENQHQKINFWTLFEKFKLKVIKHFLITTIWTILVVFAVDIVSNITSGKLKGNDYATLLPAKLQQCFPSLTLEKFAFLGLLLAFFCAFTVYFSNLWEEELRIRGDHYITNRLLDKFRQLPFENKQSRSKEINFLVEKDTGEVSYTWEHLPNHVYHCFLAIILLFFFRWESFQQMDTKGKIFSLFWLVLINVVSFFFTRLVLKNEKKYKEELNKEWAAINKETEKANLIESMGLTSQYRTKQRKISQKNKNLLFSFNYTKSLNKTIPGSWLIEMFPYLLLLVVGTFSGTSQNLLPMWWIFKNFKDIFKCFWEYGEYASSLSRVNSFLALPEKNDNLQGIIFPEKVAIKAINFEKVSFKYQNSSEWIIENYTYSFTKGKINRLLGENGIGKSTILYLILGVLQPQQGKILIIDEDGKIYNLQEINLKHWRENKVAYASHDNLIEEGSTGQRQSTNLTQLFAKRTQAEIFLFDEADNALDQEKQRNFEANLENYARNKLVIYTKH